MIESALARPYSGYYRLIASKAAALVESFAKNHGFADGNKRTTVIPLDVILTDSDYRLSVPGQDVETMVLDVVETRMQFNELEQWFKDRIERIP